MKKTTSRQILSAVLSLVFCVSVIASIPFTASAAYEAYAADGSVVTEADIILDPGHGGEDPGAMGPDDENGARREEDDDNLRLALKVGEYLEAQGKTVAYTRITDKTVDLYDRPLIANSGNYKIFCSLHRNSFDNPTATGVEVYYHNSLSADSESGRIAAKVLENIMKTPAEIANRGTKTANYVVLRETLTNSILVETLFISNPDDNAVFDTYFDELASNIANGLIESLAFSTPNYMLDGRFYPVDMGTDFVASIVHIPTGLALTNTGESNVIAAEADFGDAQTWTFVKTGLKNEYKLINHLDNRCLDTDSMRSDDGTNIMIWDDNGFDCQRFYFYDVNGNYYIAPVHCKNDRVLDVYAETNNVQIYLFGETNPQQQFRIVREGEEEPPVVEPPIVEPPVVNLELTGESTYTLESFIVGGIKAPTTVEDFALNFKNENVKVVNAEGEEVESSDFVGTGCVVSASDTEETAVVIVLGDVDGDGELTATDYLRIKQYFLKTMNLEGVYFTAADVDRSGSIDGTDYMQLKSHFLGIIDIYA